MCVMKENPCLGCSRNCCFNFKISTELTNPDELKRKLEKFPFIKRVGSDIVMFQGRERIVGVYQCDRFDPIYQSCRNYDTEPRPDFCKNTGIVNYPHNECLLMSNK